jgi:hypothetical protein
MRVFRGRHWSIVIVVLFLAASSPAFAQAPAPQALSEARAEVDRLKQELAALR